MKLSVIIPVFNEEKTIREVIKRVASVKIHGVDIEIIVVDDGSTDGTSAKLKAQSLKRKNIAIIAHKKNQGKGATVRTGIMHAGGDYILIQDADLEYHPEDIKKLIDPVRSRDAKVVYGTRLKRLPNFSRDERTPRFLLHYIGNRMLSLLTSILYGEWITDMETGYKLFPKESVNNINLNAKRFDFEPEITAKLLKKGYKILEVPISTNPRGYEEGKKLNTVRDGAIALWALLKYRFIN